MLNTNPWHDNTKEEDGQFSKKNILFLLVSMQNCRFPKEKAEVWTSCMDLGLQDNSSSTSQITFLLCASPARLWGSHTEFIGNEAEESLGFSGHSSPELLLSWHTQSQHCREALSPPPPAPFSPKLRAVVNSNPLLKKSFLRAWEEGKGTTWSWD